MINGFEEHTADLDTYDKQFLIPAMIKGLKTKVGKGNAITNKNMIKGLEKHGFKISEAKVRKMINYIRNNALVPCLIATSKGYYIGETLQELTEYIESLHQREKAIKEVRVAIQNQINEKYENQNQTNMFNL